MLLQLKALKIKSFSSWKLSYQFNKLCGWNIFVNYLKVFNKIHPNNVEQQLEKFKKFTIKFQKCLKSFPKLFYLSFRVNSWKISQNHCLNFSFHLWIQTISVKKVFKFFSMCCNIVLHVFLPARKLRPRLLCVFSSFQNDNNAQWRLDK